MFVKEAKLKKSTLLLFLSVVAILLFILYF